MDGRRPCEEEPDRRPRKTPEERIYIYIVDGYIVEGDCFYFQEVNYFN